MYPIALLLPSGYRLYIPLHIHEKLLTNIVNYVKYMLDNYNIQLFY